MTTKKGSLPRVPSLLDTHICISVSICMGFLWKNFIAICWIWMFVWIYGLGNWGFWFRCIPIYWIGISVGYMTENLRCLPLLIWTLGAYILDFVVFCSYKLRYFPFFFTQLRENPLFKLISLSFFDTTKFTAYSLQTDVVLIWILSRQQLDN
jgi:hypothetical protein